MRIGPGPRTVVGIGCGGGSGWGGPTAFGHTQCRTGKDLAGDWTKLFDGDVKKSAELFARKARYSLCRCDKRV
ncbi:hypothetical protein Y032_0570g96 [Ancylostoma ceylanicum]|uniref:Uncharacterized protein n=1 Tax=Ancylostoma ceylanicum TaxID=53326 RepID=A0A016WQ61_9BILA|nr:hypothetical protein Y032_0570g96 [Ancylostoma ceylanicum]